MASEKCLRVGLAAWCPHLKRMLLFLQMLPVVFFMFSLKKGADFSSPVLAGQGDNLGWSCTCSGFLQRLSASSRKVACSPCRSLTPASSLGAWNSVSKLCFVGSLRNEVCL